MDGATQYAMVEKTKFHPNADYPGKATVIFYKNGPCCSSTVRGCPKLPPTTQNETPYYMEAELNSPMVSSGQEKLRLRHQLASLAHRPRPHYRHRRRHGGKPLAARRSGGKLNLSGSFGFFFAGELKAYLYDRGGLKESELDLQAVGPQDLLLLHQTIAANNTVARVSIHLIDSNGVDRGALGEVLVTIDQEGQ